jgi:6-pyruvoyltetrahydropterin/6-carboxytetrahydropterin synthase
MSQKSPQKPICRMARRVYFSAAHKLYNSNLTLEQNIALYGSQAATNGLGHNYILEAHLEGPQNEDSGMILPLAQLDGWLKEVVAGLDHRFLNYDVPYFKDRVPTAENLAAYCYQFLCELVLASGAPSIRLAKIRLYETEDHFVDCGIQLTPEI